MHNKYVLITGGSCGIGLAIAKVFARHGHNLILVARNIDVLNQVSKEISEKFSVKVAVIAEDLSLPDSAERIFTECQSRGLEVEVLVNNAGFGNYGYFPLTNKKTDRDLVMVNIIALTELTKFFLPKMIKTKRGKILNLGSMASFMPGAFMNTYFASKAYVLSFSEALREELRGSGVTVSCLCPGPTESNFGKRANYQFKSHNKIKMTAERVAEIAFKGLSKDNNLIIPGLKNKILYQLNKLVPLSFRARALRYYSGYRDYHPECE